MVTPYGTLKVECDRRRLLEFRIKCKTENVSPQKFLRACIHAYICQDAHFMDFFNPRREECSPVFNEVSRRAKQLREEWEKTKDTLRIFNLDATCKQEFFEVPEEEFNVEEKK